MFYSDNRTRKSDGVLIREMDSFLQSLKNQPDDKAYSEAIQALQRTGVITKSGKAKKKIVSWE